MVCVRVPGGPGEARLRLGQDWSEDWASLPPQQFRDLTARVLLERAVARLDRQQYRHQQNPGLLRNFAALFMFG